MIDGEAGRPARRVRLLASVGGPGAHREGAQNPRTSHGSQGHPAHRRRPQDQSQAHTKRLPTNPRCRGPCATPRKGNPEDAKVAHERRRRRSDVSLPLDPMGSSLSSLSFALGLVESGVGVAPPLRRVMPEDRTGESEASSGGFEPRAETAGQARVDATRKRSPFPVVGFSSVTPSRVAPSKVAPSPTPHRDDAPRVSRGHRSCFYVSRGCTAPRGIVRRAAVPSPERSPGAGIPVLLRTET